MGKYGISQSVTRFEDPKLLRGGGDFIDDDNAHGQLHALVVRSPHAHAEIRSVDISAAQSAPGVVAVFIGSDYKTAGWGPVPHIGPPVTRRDGADLQIPEFWPIAVDRVRMVGEGVAFVVAESLSQARDAADLVMVDYVPLPGSASTAAALDTDAFILWDQIGDNEALVHQIGDREATNSAFEKATYVVEKRFTINRVLGNAMEMRACLATHDQRTNHYTLRAPIQHPWIARKVLASSIIGIEELQIRVVTPDVGGSFGIKANVYPEYLIALFAAQQTGRPVKWVADRTESFLSDFHARDNVSEASLAVDKDGTFLGFRLKNMVNIGAYFSPIGAGPAVNNLGSLSGVYTTPAAFVEIIGVFTNSHPTAPYRGAGRPEAAYILERLIDMAARDLGFDPVELRRRNLIPVEGMPFRTSLTFTYDCGEFEKNMDEALALADRDGFLSRLEASKTAGKLRGFGVANAIERASPPGVETAEIRFDPSGTVTVLSGTTHQGQGHTTMYTQLLCDRLGLLPEHVRVIEGDTDRIAFGMGAGGSRCSALGSAALMMAADKIIDKGCEIAAHILEAATDDLEFADGRFSIAGTDRAIPLADIVNAAFSAVNLPVGTEPGMSAYAAYKGDVASYPNGCHVCEVEIDPETGRVEIINYVVVDDFGTLLNPLLVKGQVHGGVAQGAGQILLENTVYDEDGQLLTASFMDYGMPRADDFCNFQVKANSVPTATNPLGVKGVGEAGTVGAMPVVMNAVLDALSPLGIRDLDMPATPARVWAKIQAAGSDFDIEETPARGHE
ncbi:MAG: xanthine dehydrogenase family protein molybdopterin-binding subunit [Pseudomonadota bacterium]|nr:xanthine dehydrogenase family protein molybdopterin-binding subunit [Pseudomonadota bacterium]